MAARIDAHPPCPTSRWLDRTPRTGRPRLDLRGAARLLSADGSRFLARRWIGRALAVPARTIGVWARCEDRASADLESCPAGRRLDRLRDGAAAVAGGCRLHPVPRLDPADDHGASNDRV